MESEFAVCTNMVTNAAAALGGRRVKSKVVPLSVGKCVNGSTHLSSAHAILMPAAQIWAFNVMSLRVINCHPYVIISLGAWKNTFLSQHCAKRIGKSFDIFHIGSFSLVKQYAPIKKQI